MAHHDGAMRRSPLRQATERLAGMPVLDRLVEVLHPAAHRLHGTPSGRVLSGEWYGHALHPALTDLPIGCWTSAALLDLVGGRRSRRAAQRLIGLGVVAAPAVGAAGLVDWSGVKDEGDRRVGAAHAAGNVLATVLYLRSWRSRRAGHHLRGIGWSILGAGAITVTGHLGGHLAFARGVGVQRAEGERTGEARIGGTATDDLGRDEDGFAGPEELLGVAGAGAMLGVPEQQVRAMIDEGLLTPVTQALDGPRFRRSEVEAVRTLGG